MDTLSIAFGLLVYGGLCWTSGYLAGAEAARKKLVSGLWKYQGRLTPGSYKQEFSRKFFDIQTGEPPTHDCDCDDDDNG